MMMNNIKNTMCRLSDLTQQQIDSLVDAMPDDGFTDFSGDGFIGVNTNGHWGTFAGLNNPTIILYSSMMQLLGKDMNKQTAQEQMAVMQIEMDKLKAIIDRPEVKTGRVMSPDDLKYGVHYWCVYSDFQMGTFTYDMVDIRRIEAGLAFHDKETAEKHLEYLKLEQELRRAQIADGGAGINSILLTKNGSLHNELASVYHEKISFNTREARDAFRNTYTKEQLTLLIRGV
jgi:hypothetical protein